MFFAHYDNDGIIVGFYTDDIHKHIPTPNIVISDEEWNDCIINQGKWRINIDSKKLILSPPLPLPQKEELIEIEILTIKNKYKQQKKILKEQYLEAIMLDDIVEVDIIKKTFQAIVIKCNNEINNILNQ